MAKETSQEQALQSVEKIIRQTRGKFSPEDAVAETGYSLDAINSALQRLLELYRAKVVMNPQTGSLMFEFHYPLQKINKKTFNEILYNFLSTLWKIFTVIYKAATGIILVFYTILFIVIIIAVLLFASSSDRDDRGGGLRIDVVLGGLIRGILQGLSLMAWTGTLQNVTDPSGLTYKKYGKEKNSGKNFVQSVFSFVFGPDNPKPDPNADAKEMISFIRQKSKGKLTAADIVLLSGLSYDKAEEKLAEYAAKYKGELSISETGTIVADFTNLLNIQAKDLDGGKIIYYYNEIDPPAEHTGNSIGKNLLIIGMNAFNMFVSYTILSSATDPLVTQGSYTLSPFLIFALGWFPLIFSISFFLIPIIRIPFTLSYSSKRKKMIMLKKVFNAIFTQPTEKLTFNQIANAINLPKDLFDNAKHSLEKLIIDLRGEIQIGEDGTPIYNFEKVKQELSISQI